MNVLKNLKFWKNFFYVFYFFLKQIKNKKNEISKKTLKTNSKFFNYYFKKQ